MKAIYLLIPRISQAGQDLKRDPLLFDEGEEWPGTNSVKQIVCQPLSDDVSCFIRL